MTIDTRAILEGLNPEQHEAASHFEGPLLVLAGAGSGKTRVLTARIAHLIQHHGVPPHRIMAVTFTNKAAGEMRERVRRMLGDEPTGLWMGTFHAIGARLLRRHADQLGWTRAFTILDAEQSLRLMKRAQESLDIDPKRWNPAAIRSHVSNAKNRLVTPLEFAELHGDGFDPLARRAAQVYAVYQERLRSQNAFDFDDLLVKPVELIQEIESLRDRYSERFAFILVDEYQDTNHAQFRFLELLARRHENLMVVGDDDQSIYGWRGADISNILDFEKTFPGATVVRLERNYRSTERILDAANAVIRLNLRRKGKTLRTERRGGEPLTLLEAQDETDEARWIVDEIERCLMDDPQKAHRDAAVLYRTNAQARALEDAFRRRGLPYQVVGGVRFYERREIQDVLAYLRLISNPRDAGAFDRVVNYPRRGIGDTTQVRLAKWAEAAGRGLLEAAERAEEAPSLPAAGARSLVKFAESIRRFSVLATQCSVGELIEELVRELDLIRVLEDEGPGGDDRAANVKELIAGALDFTAEVLDAEEEDERDLFSELDLFLQQVALVADIDQHDAASDAVTLMTLHNAKGLEFPTVFISGMEDGLFPLSRAFDEPEQLEEERRLFYVGVTRAMDKLYLTYALQRRRAGEILLSRASSFLDALPSALLERRSTLRSRREFVPPHRGQPRRRPGRTDAFEPDFDESLNQDLPRFVKGERVVHETFGSGSVRDVSGFGRDLKVTVDFDTVGPKKLLVRYAGLQRDYE